MNGQGSFDDRLRKAFEAFADLQASQAKLERRLSVKPLPPAPSCLECVDIARRTVPRPCHDLITVGCPKRCDTCPAFARLLTQLDIVLQEAART